MPEMLEVEMYRRLAEGTVGRAIAAVDAPDSWILKRGTTAEEVVAALEGRRFVGADRVGKLLLLATDDGPTLGLRFGMTGVLEVDGVAAAEDWAYASSRKVPEWARFTVHFDGGGWLLLRDARRLGGVELDPDVGALGPDAARVTPAGLRRILEGSDAPLKARLMDQARLAGLGNLLTDELLWRAGLDPARWARDLSPAEVRRLHRHLRSTLDELGRRGGSHTGDLQESRVRGGRCPRCVEELQRRTIGGRTTYSCPRHQR